VATGYDGGAVSRQWRSVAALPVAVVALAGCGSASRAGGAVTQVTRNRRLLTSGQSRTCAEGSISPCRPGPSPSSGVGRLDRRGGRAHAVEVSILLGPCDANESLPRGSSTHIPTVEVGMSILVRFTPTDLTAEQYDETIRRLEAGAAGDFPPKGLDYHVCFGSAGDLRVSEVWDSEEHFRAFGERLTPVLSEVGIEFSGPPEIVEVRNAIRH